MFTIHYLSLLTLSEPSLQPLPSSFYYLNLGVGDARVRKNRQRIMKLLVVGATGRSGLMFVESALHDGHHITAVVRTEPAVPNTLSSNTKLIGTGASSEVLSGQEALAVAPPHAEVISHANLTVVVANIKSEDALAALLPGHDAVVATLGAWPEDGKSFTLHQDSARAYAPAMNVCGVKRLLVCFGMGVLFPRPGPEATGVFEVMRRDMFVALDEMTQHDLDFTIWCPPDFPHGPRSEDYTEAIGKPAGDPSGSVTTGMVADAMCKELIANRYSKQLVGIASGK